MKPTRVVFLLFDGVHLLDLAGPVTVFYESGCCGRPYELHYVSPYPHPAASAGIGFTAIAPLNSVTITSEDIVVVAGMDLSRFRRADDVLWVPWLRTAAAAGAVICSVCTAAFALAVAGLLQGHNCTTHWAYTRTLQQQFPELTVLENKLFVKSGRIYTSAGIATGIDLALFLVEEQHGAEFAYRVAKDMVVYIRRNGTESQHSVFLQNRQHVSYVIHQVQDYIACHLHQKITIDVLAVLVYVSPRSVTRLFKKATGSSIGQYIQQLRVEKAQQLLKANHKMESVARECGFKGPGQLLQLLKKEQKAASGKQ
ncbi:transcriptional regulator GlxA family with amidase domain [Filimonas zeae]|uniref:AraC family transcriptional regulator n=1 Tax=Filimonas zeae TaxID=1737353 RepID=A0A917J446_9BACT|nr:DJ-1/PfpI family protein [Filimonas zeae]MDR6342069.1 transcriptional regulator GlxA family with amidase domain [Filimonas zeae]GGH79230.1 AraC family transcriptional regulator [Filimonas zeae]